MSQFQFGNFENRRGGSLFFKNVPISIILQLFCIFTFIKNVWNSKMSQFGQRGGGQHFSKMSQIQKCPKGRKGGGSTLIGTLSQIFSIFYFDGSPKPSWDWYLVFTKVKQPTSKASTTKKGPKYEGDLQINIYCNLNRIFINYVIQERGGGAMISQDDKGGGLEGPKEWHNIWTGPNP